MRLITLYTQDCILIWIYRTQINYITLHYYQAVLRLRMKGATHPLPLYALTACTGTTFIGEDYLLTQTNNTVIDTQ